MPHERTILRSLCGRLLELYCPEAAMPRPPGRTFFTKRFMLALNNCWHIDPSKLPGEETFYNAMHLRYCSDATKEKFAVFYYAFIDEVVRKQMPGLYFNINSQRPASTPYWNRYVEEYKKEHAQDLTKHALINHIMRGLKKKSLSELKEIAKEIGKRGRRK